MQNFLMLKELIHKLLLLVKWLMLKSVNWMFVHWVVNDIRWMGLKTDEQLVNCYELMMWELCPCDNLTLHSHNVLCTSCSELWLFQRCYFCSNAIYEPPHLTVIQVPPIITEVLLFSWVLHGECQVANHSDFLPGHNLQSSYLIHCYITLFLQCTLNKILVRQLVYLTQWSLKFI